MRFFYVVLIAIVVIAGCASYREDNPRSNHNSNDNSNYSNKILDDRKLADGSLDEVISMKISSPDFRDNDKIPERFTCNGENISPPLMFSSIPQSAKSLVLIVDDPDAPGGTWLHWLVFNIPPMDMISEDSVPGVVGKNSWGKSEYGGPCPPSGTHRYFFRLYALDTVLSLDEGASLDEVKMAMQGHVIEDAEFYGIYSKPS